MDHIKAPGSYTAGRSWFIHCGQRPSGRIVHLQPMKWINDCQFGSDPDGDGTGEPVSSLRSKRPGNIPTATPVDTDDSTDRLASVAMAGESADELGASLAAYGLLRLAIFRRRVAPKTLGRSELCCKVSCAWFTVTTRVLYGCKLREQANRDRH